MSKAAQTKTAELLSQRRLPGSPPTISSSGRGLMDLLRGWHGWFGPITNNNAHTLNFFFGLVQGTFANTFELLGGLRYEKLPRQLVDYVIRGGVLCRSMWVVFPPLILYKFIRGTDRAMWSVESFYLGTRGGEAQAYWDMTRPGWGGHWKAQADLEQIYRTSHGVTEPLKQEAAEEEDDE
ncbi:unnamed protein product [Vitrella brassicaformis CCMP3155]|uniref:Uncharacterized protein n=1 Tax=Vitrella brassicaformis (strain CCMP3155) TaxID=1169540 RepID=A0A0G4EBI1_VITBC|nr:unnamed protein product [Vitrella brassicaformis CCMP3155]|eukprot:CEL92877.1 unnamed protein product [Vitrella brassicaformis CCMP3155]